MARPNFDCTTCNKFHPDRHQDPASGGQCRAHPPVTIIVGAKIDRLSNQQSPIFQTIFPVVLKEHYCFEHPLATADLPILRRGPSNPVPAREPGL